MKRLTLPKFWCCAATLAAVVCLWTQPPALAQDAPPPLQGTSRGENFSAKPPAALFASDCTGAGCHKGPQGLGKSVGIGGLAGFLREHYTNSRESAAALANYLSKLPSGAEPRDARVPRGGRPAAAAPASGGPGWADGILSPEAKPAPNEARAPRQTPGGRTSRASTRPDDDPAVAPPPAATPPSGRPPGELTDAPKPAETSPKPAEAAPKPAAPTARAQRGRQQPTAAVTPPPAAPEAVSLPPPPPAPPPPKEFDIFD